MRQRNDTATTVRVNLPDGSYAEVAPGGELDCDEQVGGFTNLDEPDPEPEKKPRRRASTTDSEQ